MLVSLLNNVVLKDIKITPHVLLLELMHAFVFILLFSYFECSTSLRVHIIYMQYKQVLPFKYTCKVILRKFHPNNICAIQYITILRIFN